MAIQLNGSEKPDFQNPEKVRNALIELMSFLGFRTGEIVYVFIDKKAMIKLNTEVLDHRYATDIITFDESVNKRIYCDIFLCPEVIMENAQRFKVNFETELFRVMVHGLLHCMGWNDVTEKEKIDMRIAEEKALKFLHVSRETNTYL